MKRQGKIEYRKGSAVRLILSTFPSRREAARVARGLIQQKLAACCNVVPGLLSFFRWKGKTEEVKEVLLLSKTVTSRLPQALRYVKGHHPYELPELVVLSLEGGDSSYLKWIVESCKK